MSVRLELFLAARAAIEATQLEMLADGVRRAVPGVPVRSVAHAPAVISGLAHGDETAEAPPYEGLLELTLPDEGALDDALTPVSAVLRAATWLDLGRSAVVVGTHYSVVPGSEPLMLAMALHRKPGLSRPMFSSYWKTKHAELGRAVPGSQGYCQVHASSKLWKRAQAALGVSESEYDGVAIAYYRDNAAFMAIMANVAVVEPLLEDERRFIDHSRSAMVVGR